MSHVVRFRVSLICTICGSLNDERSSVLYTASLGESSTDTYANAGDVLHLEMIDFEDGYFTLRRPTDDRAVVVALEVWGCKTCQRTQAARIIFERVGPAHWRFAEATVVPLSGAILEEADFVSRRLEELAPNPGDDADRVHAIVQRLEKS